MLPVAERPLILLAPMEGLLDFTLRDLLTRVHAGQGSSAGNSTSSNGIDRRTDRCVDRCVSEFIRITDQLLPPRVYTRVMPELLNGSRTPAGVPVRAQLLGSDPACLADNAALLASLGAEGIDLNFGCPTKVVNRHRGGAVLLKEPELIHAIVRAVRAAVPAHLPVSAKMRLGYDDTALTLDCARALHSGGACEIVVHARTRAHGYRPPAYWDQVHAVTHAVPVPVIANGEIWTVQDAQRARAESGCTGLMLGRGAVADPGLALAIRAADAGRADAPLPWHAVLPMLHDYWHLTGHRFEPRHHAGRLKQWLHHLARRYPEAQDLYRRVRVLSDARSVGEVLGVAVPLIQVDTPIRG